jgi:hypothetical protein
VKNHPGVFQRVVTRKMQQNPILGIETMDLTIEPSLSNIALPKSLTSRRLL